MFPDFFWQHERDRFSNGPASQQPRVGDDSQHESGHASQLKDSSHKDTQLHGPQPATESKAELSDAVTTILTKTTT